MDRSALACLERAATGLASMGRASMGRAFIGRTRVVGRTCVALACITLLAMPLTAQSSAALDLGSEAQIADGKVLYDKYCSQCHGENGDGEGIAATRLRPAPRDFTPGKYKIRQTPTGALPTTEDIKRSIRLGLPYSAMPAFPIFSDTQLTNLAYYLKSFSEDFKDPDAYQDPFPIPEAPSFTDASAERGQELYIENGCVRCHGELGRGDGSSAPAQVDDWGYTIKVADLTKPWTFRGGATREDIYRSMSSGLTGSPMPGFYGSLSEEDIWSIVDYIASLSGNRQEAPYANLVNAQGTRAELDLANAEELFAEAPAALLPVIGQIMEPGRNFYPSALDVSIQAVFNREEIAFRVTWHDMRAETNGANGPDLEVPLWEVDQGGSSGAASSDGSEDGGFWGEEESAEDDGGGFWGEEEAPAEEASGEDFWGEDAAADNGAADAEGGDDFWGDDEGGAASTDSGVESEFSDAVALQFPAKMPAGIRKPYFLFGDLENPVHLWFADLASQAGKLYDARGSGSITESEARAPEMISSYQDGQWTVVFKRKRKGPGIVFEEGTFVPIAATVWDGFNRERGNKRGLTAWYNVYMVPLEAPSPLGPMARAGLGVLGLELLIIALVRRNKKKKEASAAA